MRQFVPWMAIFSMLVLMGTGCGEGDGKQVPKTSSETASPEMQQSAAVVREFITAILKGYDEQAFTLLSQKAQNEYKSMGREFQFPADDQAEFKIDGVAVIPNSNNELFGVAVTMTEKIGNEVKITESSWGVRNDNGTFCIIGVVMSDDGLTMELDFEDLAGTDAKMQQMREQQMQALEKIATVPQDYTLQPPLQNNMPQQNMPLPPTMSPQGELPPPMTQVPANPYP